MSPSKIVLLHGPVNSVGMNVVSQHFEIGAEGQRVHWSPFDTRPNIIALSKVFRALGYQLVYSGWHEDREWLEANRQLFDGLVLSDQTNLKSEDRLGSTVYPNNKDKLFFSVMQGLAEVERLFGADAAVLRLRSDCAVKAELLEPEMAKAQVIPQLMLIEHLNMDNMLIVPDFMMISRVGVMRAMYTEMFERSITGNGYHISSHIDISLTLIGMRQQGRLQAIECMSRELFDSLVWRGLPRYLEETLYPNPARAFSCEMHVPPGFDLPGQIAQFAQIMAVANASAAARALGQA